MIEIEQHSVLVAIILFVLGSIGFLIKHFFFNKNTDTGSITNVISNYQSGGQTAHTIINHKSNRRKVDNGFEKKIIKELKTHPSQNFEIMLMNGDSEANDIANQIKDILEKSGWTIKGFIFNLAGSYKPGIEIAVGKNVSEAEQQIANLFNSAGLKVTANKYDNVKNVKIIVGPNPDNYL
jgi:ATP-dependent protease HslVU (ClpYQ) ATPase subunit